MQLRRLRFGVRRCADALDSRSERAVPLPSNSLVFFHQIAVGHSCDVIADGAMQSLVLDPSRGALANPVSIDKIGFENASQHLASPPIHFGYARMIINILV